MTEKTKDEAVLTDAAKDEIAAAVAIVASDRNSRNLEAIRKHLMPDTPENTPAKDGDPTPPPKKDEAPDGTPDEEQPKKKAGIWWGDRIED